MEIPKSLENIWNKVSSDGFITKEDYNAILNEAAPNKLPEEIDGQEEKFLETLHTKLTKDISKGKVPVSEIIFENDTQENKVEENANNNKKEKNNKVDNTNNIKQNNQVSNNKYSIDIPIPDTLKAVWNEVSKKGVINADDFEKIKLAAAPNKKNAEFDNDEINFLAELYDRMEQQGGTLTLNTSSKNSNNNDIVVQDSQVYKQNSSNNQNNQVSSDNKFTVLLNWPGYNNETKSALKNAFPNDFIMSKDMPLLTTKKAKEISNSFNLNSIMELQRLVGAKVDGKFGPETFFKVKVYLANQINNNSMPKEKILAILNNLGNDREVTRMINFLNSV